MKGVVERGLPQQVQVRFADDLWWRTASSDPSKMWCAAAACRPWREPAVGPSRDWQAIYAAWLVLGRDLKITDFRADVCVSTVAHIHSALAVGFEEFEIAFDGSSHRQRTCDAIGRPAHAAPCACKPYLAPARKLRTIVPSASLESCRRC